MQTNSMLEDKIINDLIQQVREGGYKDDLGHELINNKAFVDFMNLWLDVENL